LIRGFQQGNNGNLTAARQSNKTAQEVTVPNAFLMLASKGPELPSPEGGEQMVHLGLLWAWQVLQKF